MINFRILASIKFDCIDATNIKKKGKWVDLAETNNIFIQQKTTANSATVD